MGTPMTELRDVTWHGITQFYLPPDTRTRPTLLTLASKLVFDLPTPGMEGWVDLGYTAMYRPGVEPAISRSQVQRPTTTPSSNLDVYNNGAKGPRKGLDAGSVRLPTDRVLFHAHTTHSVTGVSLLPGHVSGTASQQTYVTRTSPTRVSGVNLKRTGLVFLRPVRNVTFCLIALYK